MQNHSGILIKENMGTSPLMEEKKKILVNVEDASCSVMMVIPTK